MVTYADCDHTISIFNTMETKLVRGYYVRRCIQCDYKDVLKRAGRIRRGYSIKADTLREFDRRKYAKDLLQPQEYDRDKKDFVLNELYEEAWGDPKDTKADIGSKVEEARIKDET